MHRLFLVMALPCLVGCQTDGTNSLMARAALSGNEAAAPADAKYSLIYDQGDHLRDLIAGKRLAEAAEVVEKHWPWFAPRLETQRDRLRLVGEDLNARARPKLEAAASPLDATTDFTRPGNWPEQRRLRSAGTDALAAYDKSQLTRRPEFRSDRATVLEQAMQRFDERARAAAPAAFARYDHGAETGFFSAFPIDLDRPAFLRAQLAALDGPARQLTPDTILRWHRSIGRAAPFDADQRARVGRWLVDAAIRASGAKRPGWKEVQGAWRLAMEHGLPVSLPERPRMRVVLLDSGAPSGQGGDGGAPVQIAAHGELAPERVELTAALADPAVEVLLLIDPLERRLEQAVVERASVASRFLAREVVVPNPVYEEARERAIEAKHDLARAQYRSAAYAGEPSTTAEAGAGLAAVIAEIVAGRRADAAIANVRHIPPTVRQPVYEEYKYEVAAVKANRIATVAWHVLDRSSGSWRQGNAKVEEAKTFRVAYRLHERDVRRQQILREHQTEQELVAWGDGAAMVPLSAVLRAATSGEGQERRPGSFARAGDELRRQRTTMTAAARPAPAPTAKGDARMDSVVVIHTPDGGGPGAGFFVTPDTVVTNAHVVEQHRFVEIKLRDGRSSFGRVMAVLEYADLAIVRTEARGTPARLSARAGPEVGSTIEVIGHPKDLEYSLSRGVVSAVRQQRISDTPGATLVTLVQTDAAASPGNSGGPWFQQGEVIAVTSFKRRGGENLNFGIHVSVLRDFLRKHAVEVP